VQNAPIVDAAPVDPAADAAIQVASAIRPDGEAAIQITSCSTTAVAAVHLPTPVGLEIAAVKVATAVSAPAETSVWIEQAHEPDDVVFGVSNLLPYLVEAQQRVIAAIVFKPFSGRPIRHEALDESDGLLQGQYGGKGDGVHGYR
jgi:hypothetical protein